MDKRIVNRRVVEALVRAGAFDAIDSRRASLLASVGIALDGAEQASRHAQQVSLFGEIATADSMQLIEARLWTDVERLQNEKAALGFYLSGHPFSAHRNEVRKFVRTSLDQLKPSADYGAAQNVLIAGVVESLRKFQSARLFAVNLSDGTATQEITVYSEVFDKYRAMIAEDRLLIIEAKLRTVRRGDDPDAVFLRINAERIYDLAAARGRFARRVKIAMNGHANAAKLKELLAPYCNGGCPVSIVYNNGDARCEVELGEKWRVDLRDDLIHSLHAWLRAENVTIIYPQSAV
jgi:DNA polymerase-3 subunit alpha